jgi:hypothetical protein
MNHDRRSTRQNQGKEVELLKFRFDFDNLVPTQVASLVLRNLALTVGNYGSVQMPRIFPIVNR